jgi:pimeloyl-ACP methyl ester carboxylesterase
MSHVLGRIAMSAPAARPDWRSRTARLITALLGWLLLVSPSGCSSITVREDWLRDTIVDQRDRLEAMTHLSSATGALLARHGLRDRAASDPAAAARELEALLQTQPEVGGDLALAELSYHAAVLGHSTPRRPEMELFRDAAALAWVALADPANLSPGLAVRIHNGALKRLIRASQAEAGRRGRNWRQVLDEVGIELRTATPYLEPHQISDLRVAADLRTNGMDHVYRKDGLGVPLVAHRVVTADLPSPDPGDEFLPRDLRTGATALLTAGGESHRRDWRKHGSTLLLLDSFGPSSLTLGGKEVELASDHTTPLAALVAGRRMAMLEWAGLFEAGFHQKGVETGLYMSRPYEPGKIPVVFVHGLFSSPRAWVQTMNELTNSPAIASRYQFWVFLYATGMPIPASADRLRESLTKVRDELDPSHADQALDQMVLVGHSMGGVLSKMMAQDTGSVLWNAAITIPRDRFRAPPELGKSLDKLLVFQPLPFVRRVVFIATPHRGSPIADGPVGFLVSRLVRRPNEQAAHVAEIEALNGPNVLSPELHGPALNAIGNLRTNSPILAALDRIPIDPKVPYHSIIPLIGAVTNTDGVVEYRSSHVERARSELIVAGTHLSQEAPEVTRELRRILLDHAHEAPQVVRAAARTDLTRD